MGSMPFWVKSLQVNFQHNAYVNEQLAILTYFLQVILSMVHM